LCKQRDDFLHGTSTVTKTGETITGKQQKTLTVTGKYGEKGTMSTDVTQKTSVSKLNTSVNVAVLASISSQNQTQNANKLGVQIRDGDFGGALSTVVDMSRQALNNLLGGIPSGIAEGYSGLADLKNNSVDTEKLLDLAKQSSKRQAAAEKSGDFAGAVTQAAAAKAAQGAAKAAQKESGANTSGRQLAEASRNKDGSYSQLYLRRVDIKSGSNVDPKPEIRGYKYQIDKYNGIYNWSHVSFSDWYKGGSLPDGYDYVSGYHFKPITSDKDFQDALKKVSGETPQEQQKNVKDMTLNGDDIQKILERMLESQQTNHKELMQQLAKMGDAVEKATTSKEFTPSFAYSDPYTPAGSDSPQQTRFEIDKNGNVTTSTVSRPDLKPNSSQAPTRSVIVPNKETGQQTGQQGQQQGQEQGTGHQKPTNQTGQQTGTQQGTNTQTGQTSQTNQQNQQQQEFCEKNPNSSACAELGEADYEDLSIPESNIDLKLKPMDIFSTDGTCPANPTFSMGALGTFEIPYDYFCKIARMLRPILIIGTIIMCGFFAYNAVKEL